MKKITAKFLYLVLTLFLIGCSQRSEINDIIPPLKLVSGNTDTVLISDLYYSDDYNIDFSEIESLEIEHDKKNNLLVLKPDENFEGITLLEFKADMNIYHIPVTAKKQDYYGMIENTQSHPRENEMRYYLSILKGSS